MNFAINDASTSICTNKPIDGDNCLFHVLWNEHWEDTDIWIWAWAAGSFGAGYQVCVEQEKLPDTRGRRQE